MKRLGSLVLGLVTCVVLGTTAWSQSSKSSDNPCAQYETAPKGETAAAKKTRTAADQKCKKKEKKKEKKEKKTAKKPRLS